MPWSNSWSGLGPIRATSLQVIGSGTEIDIINTPGGGGVPPGSAILFDDISGNNAAQAAIFSQRDAPSNGMGLSLLSQAKTPNPAQAELDMIPGDVNFTVFGSGGGQQVSTLELKAATAEVIVNQSLTMINNPNNGQSYLQVVGESWHVPTLLNGWTQRSGYQTLAYRFTPTGGVEFKGAINAGTVTDNTEIFALDASHSPNAQVLVTVKASPNAVGTLGPARLWIQPDGTARVYGLTGGSASTTFIDLTGSYFILVG